MDRPTGWRAITVIGVTVLASSIAVCAAPRNFIRDGGFERSASGNLSPAWIGHAAFDIADDVRHSGARSLHVRPGSLVEQSIFAVSPGQSYACSGWMQTRDVTATGAGGHAFIAVYQYDDAGDLLTFADFAQVTRTTDWTGYTYVFQASRATARVAIHTGIWQASGEAWVDDLTLIAGREPAEWEPGMDGAPEAATRPERVAVLRDDLPPKGAPSSPEFLAGLLRDGGIDVRLLTAAELADPNIFSRAGFDLVVLPYGPAFPLEAQQTLQRFLAEGGDFISMGGYAFDDLVARTPKGWLPQLEAIKGEERPVAIGGDFENGAWESDRPGRSAVVSDVTHSGRHSLRVQVPAGAEPLGASSYREVPAEPGQEFVLSGWIRAGALGREAGGFAFLAEYQYGEDDKLIAWHDVASVPSAQDWGRYEWHFSIAAGVTKLRIIAGLYNTSGTAWFDDVTLVRVPHVVQMNTRNGTPRDGLIVSPTQIGVFDPSYPLERAAYAQGTGAAGVFPVDLKTDGPFEGYAASGVVGWNQARWVSLIDARDRYGRLRGSVGALMRNYAGMYAGSSWAFFGVTNRDLFAPDRKEMGEGFVQLVRLMLAGVYLHNLETDHACYSQGEQVNVSVRVANQGRQAREAQVRFAAGRGTVAGGIGFQPDPYDLGASTRRIAPGETAILQASWNPGRFDVNFYRVTATLLIDGQTVDEMETGFAVSEDQALASGPAVSFIDNYVEAGGVRHILLGTDTYGNMFGAASHNPLTWARDLGMMRDNGITVYENLQVDPRAFPTAYVIDERFARQARAMVQLSQQLHLIYDPGLLIGFDTAVGDDLLKQQAAWCESFARMFARGPSIMYYTNGDLRIEPRDTPEIRSLLAAFLKERYATPQGLQEAWKADPPITAFDQIPIQAPTSRGWDDLRVRDWRMFEWWLVRRWLTAMHDGSKVGDFDRPTTVEFYQNPYGGIDIRAALGPIDIGNIGYFGLKGSDIREFPARLKFSDMRAYAQGVSVGELGCKTHPAWANERNYHQTRTEQEQVNLYLAIPHYTLGLGGCKAQNWCWADAEESIFPWGLVHSNDRVPKRVLSAYRNVALLFKHFEPEYVEPEVWVVVPTSHRAGADSDRVYQAILACFDALVDARVGFGVVDEDRLAELPAAARVLFWPLPYCPSDEAVTAVETFVRRGGFLYFSGDISFDPDRKSTRTERLQRLAGVTLKHQNFVGLPAPSDEAPEARVAAGSWFGLRSWRGQPAIEVEASGAEVIAHGDGENPRLVVSRLDAGTVVFTPDVLEATASPEALRSVYRAALDSARVSRIKIEPDVPGLHAFRIPTRTHGAVYVLVNAAATGAHRLKLRTEHHEYEMSLGRDKTGLVVEDEAGRTLAIEADVDASRDGQLLVSGGAHFMVAAEDGRDLPDSREVLLMPTGQGRVPRISIACAAGAPEISGEVGEVVGGQWTSYEAFTSEVQQGRAGLRLDADRAVSLILLAARDRLPQLGERVARMLTEP